MNGRKNFFKVIFKPIQGTTLVQKIKILILILITCLLWGNQAYAMATYDYLSDVKISFSRLWDNISTIATPISSGAGQYSASTASTGAYDLQNSWYYQSVRITGSAGDSSFTKGGTSHAYSSVNTLLTFNLDAVPTDLTITLTDWSQVLRSAKQFNLWNPDNQTGEYIGFWPGLGGGGTALGLALDGQWFGIPNWLSGNSTTFRNLTGEHTILIFTSADETAIAGYPYVQTFEPSTLLLLGSGIVGLIGFRRKFRKLLQRD